MVSVWVRHMIRLSTVCVSFPTVLGSSVNNVDALSSKCSKVEWIHYFTQNGVDSLRHSKNASEVSETSHSPLNTEDELLDYVEIELPDISTWVVS